MERWLQHDFFGRITLRLVEASRGFRFTKDVGHAVVADAVARTEISVRVVVKGAPANPAGILLIRRQLIVNARMAQGVFGETLNIVDGLCWVGVAYKLRVQVPRMVGRLQREPEVIHRKHVFEEFGFLKIANAASLPGGIELVRRSVGASVKIMIILRFVDAHAPENDRGMIPIAPDHAADVVDRDLFPCLVANMLPRGNLLTHEQATLIASVQEVLRLRIMGGTDDVAVQLVSQDVGIAALYPPRHRLTNIGEGLVAVEAAQLDDLTIQFEAMVRKLSLPKAEAARIFIQDLSASQ